MTATTGRHFVTRRTAALWAVVCLCAVGFVAPIASGQDTNDATETKKSAAETKPEASPAGNDNLADRQAIIGDRVKRLEDRMFQLAQALKKTDPDKAQRLLEGLSALREDGLTQNIDAVVQLLKEHQLADAADAQVTLEDQMQAILKLLMEETNNLDKQREELKRLAEIRKQLGDLLDKQKAAKTKAERVDARKRLAEEMDDAAAAARDLLQRQEALNAEGGNGGANGARPADAQAALRGDTEALAREIAELAEKLRAANEGMEQEGSPTDDNGESESPEGKPSGDGSTPQAGESPPPNAGGDSSPQGGESKGDAASPSNPAGGESQAGDASETSSESKPNESDASQQQRENESAPGDVAQNAEEAKQHLDHAADAMQQAEAALRKSSESDVAGDQSAAESELRKATDKLQREADEMRHRLKLEDAADEQHRLADESQKLLDDMSGKKGAGEKSGDDNQGQKGDQKGGQQGQSGGDSQQGQQGGSSQGQQGESQQQPPASPGQRPLEEAIPHQQDAAKNLDDNLPTEAVEEQKQAIEKLEQAKEDLDERLDQLRREQQEQLLAALESRFRAMLSRQLEVNKATDRLVDLGVANWKRSDQLELAELSEKQRWVGDQADEATFLLTEEGSTVVLPPLLEEVRDDARDLADRLAAAQADREVQAVQQEIESVLRDMIDSVKKQQEELEQGGGGGSSNGSQPLLPGSAELKLLRACQLRINKSTESLYEELETNAEKKGEINAAIQRLATKQDKVADMAKAMHESLQKAQ